MVGGKRYCCELHSKAKNGQNSQCGGSISHRIGALNTEYKRMYIMGNEKIPSEIPPYDGGNPNFWRHITKEDKRK